MTFSCLNPHCGRPLDASHLRVPSSINFCSEACLREAGGTLQQIAAWQRHQAQAAAVPAPGLAPPVPVDAHRKHAPGRLRSDTGDRPAVPTPEPVTSRFGRKKTR